MSRSERRESVSGRLCPWVLSARSPAKLRARARDLHTSLQREAASEPYRVATRLAATVAVTPLPYRAVVLGRDRNELLHRLARIAEGQKADGVLSGRARSPVRTAFVFSPLRSEYRGVGIDLLDCSPDFRTQMEACEAALRPCVGWSLDEVLRERPGVPPFHRLDVSQPVLFAIGVSLAKLWEALGVRPEAVAGHSVGEIAAATTCGALTLADAGRVAATWGRSSMRLEGTGAMASIPLPAEAIRERVAERAGRLWISAINSPSRSAVSGEEGAVEELLEELAANDVVGRPMGIDAPGHSPGMDAIHDWFTEELSTIRPRAGAVPFYSAAVGGTLDPASLDSQYWSENLRHPVLFESAMRALIAAGYNFFVEVGPRPVLTEAIEEILEGKGDGVVTGTLAQGDSGYFLASLARAYVSGVDVDWLAVCGEAPRIAARYWVESGTPAAGAIADGRGAFPLASVPEAEREAALLELVRREVADLRGFSSPLAVDPGRPFKDLGFDSPAAVELRNRLIRATGLRLAATLAFDYPTPNAVAGKLQLELNGGERRPATAVGERPPQPLLDEEALSKIDELDVASLVELSLQQREAQAGTDSASAR